jgi:threonyl-tRNA synthetase
VLPISDDLTPQASDAVAKMKAAGIRAAIDTHDTLNYRIREAELMKVPYMAVIGRREAEAGTLAVRTRGAGKKQDIVLVAEFIERVRGEIVARSLVP